MNSHYDGQNYEMLLIVMVNINISFENREIKIDGKSVFYKHFFSKGIKYTEDLFYEKKNIDSFDAVRGEKLLNSNFLTWTGLRQSVPLNRQTRPPTFNVVLDWENFKCLDYYRLLIKLKYEKPKKWAKLGEGFD